MASADEWTVVNKGTNRRKVAKRRPTDRPKAETNQEQEEEVSLECVRSHLAECCRHLKSSQFYDAFVRAWKNSPAVDEIVCYGIGNFARRASAHYSGPLWQLALALEFQKICFSITDERPNNVVYYDPLVTPVERQLLEEHCQIQVLSSNERGIRNVNTNHGTTIFFMPHCPKGLYENVLWANWNRLANNPKAICIIGNSLVTYVERATTTTTSCLELIQPLVHEQLIAYSKKDVRDMPGYFEAAFNDTYFTWFAGGTDWPERPLEPSPDGQNEVL